MGWEADADSGLVRNVLTVCELHHHVTESQ